MHKQLEKYGIMHIRQFIFDVVNYKSSQLDKLDFTYPCFIKPVSGVASIGAQKIADYSSLTAYFKEYDLDNLKKKLHVFSSNENLSKFIISEYIEGNEYIVDSYSQNGMHYISSVYKYNKKIINDIPMYRSLEIIYPTSSQWNELIDYIKQCLTVLGLNNGFAHSELFLTNEGPVLIEVNPRISGLKGYINELARLGGFPTQTELLAYGVFNIISSRLSKAPMHFVMLQLFHFSYLPLPDIAQKLQKYSVVKDVKLLTEIGYIHPKMPESLIDIVAIVICGSQDEYELQQQIAQILAQDESGW